MPEQPPPTTRTLRTTCSGCASDERIRLISPTALSDRTIILPVTSGFTFEIFITRLSGARRARDRRESAELPNRLRHPFDDIVDLLGRRVAPDTEAHAR